MPEIAKGLGAINIPGQMVPDSNSYQFIEGLPIAMYTCDKEGYIRSYNQTAVNLWGREPEIGIDQWCGAYKAYWSDGSTISPDKYPIVIALKERRPVQSEEMIVERPDGSQRIITPYPRPIFDSNGTLTGAFNLLIDATEHKMIEAKIGTMAAIVQSSDDAIVSKTLQGVVTSWNDSAKRMFGYAEEEMIGQSIYKIIPKERWSEEESILSKIKRGERVDHFETKRVTQNGSLVDVSLTISPVKDAKGNIIGASKIARNITAQKLAERKIRESDERFRMAVESTKLGTWEYYPKMDKLIWSSECRKIFDMPEDLEVDLDVFFEHVHPDDLNLVRQAMNSAMETSGDGYYDMQNRILRHSDHELRWIRAQGKVYLNQYDQPERFVGTILDITEEKLAKEKLEQTVFERTRDLTRLNEQLEKSNLELEQYAYIASHDLQEPLRKIQTFAELLKRNINNEAEFGKYFEKIRYSAKRMSTLINDVLNYSRLSNANEHLADVDLNQIVSDARSDMELVIEQKKARIICEKLPTIKGTSSQLRQLFANLLSNSLKFCNTEPEIHISSKILAPAEIKEFWELKTNVNYIAITMRDNGIGFEKENAEQIFEIFKRLNGRSEYSGTGIGLALCKKIVENHNGAIKASSEGKGAVFTIVFPDK